MERRSLPGTDLALSVVGMGCWAIGGRHWGVVRDEESVAAVRRAFELGIDWFDTAPLYGHGHSDSILRRALGPRLQEVTIATKVGAFHDPAEDRSWSDLRASSIREDCEASLRRLGVEAIDLLQVHWPCERATPLAETLGELQALRAEGKIRWFGLCNYNEAGLRSALEVAPIPSLQTPYSMVRREAEDALLPLCRDRGVGVLAYETLCRGLLTAKYGATPPHFDAGDMRRHDGRFPLQPPIPRRGRLRRTGGNGGYVNSVGRVAKGRSKGLYPRGLLGYRVHDEPYIDEAPRERRALRLARTAFFLGLTPLVPFLGCWSGVFLGRYVSATTTTLMKVCFVSWLASVGLSITGIALARKSLSLHPTKLGRQAEVLASWLPLGTLAVPVILLLMTSFL